MSSSFNMRKEECAWNIWDESKVLWKKWPQDFLGFQGMEIFGRYLHHKWDVCEQSFFWNLLKIRVWLASVHNFIFHSHHAHVFSPINAIFLSNVWGKYFPLNLGFCPSWFQNASFNNLSCKFFSLYKSAEVIVFSCHDILFALFSQNIWEIIGRICQLWK